MRRRTVILVVAVALLALQPCVGHYYGVYTFPGATILDGSTGYLVRKGGAWYSVNINGSMGPHIDRTPLAGVIRTHALSVEISDPRYASAGSPTLAYALVDPIDAIRIRFGAIHASL
jgi:hypothetical protein